MAVGCCGGKNIKNNHADNEEIPAGDEIEAIDPVMNLPQIGNAAYAPIPLENLCAETAADFDLFLKNPEGKFILYRGANMTLTEMHKTTLHQNNVNYLFISRLDRTKYLHYMERHLVTILDGMVSMPEKTAVVYQSAYQLLKDVFANPEARENIERVEQLVDTTIAQVIRDDRDLINLLEVLATDFTTYTHSVNVCILGLALGRRLNVSRGKLIQLGTGLLLHDVGKTELTQDILKKTRPLSDDDWDLVKQHPGLGRDLLLQSGTVHPQSMMIVMQHHERCDGSGYPYGLTDADIHPFAKIAAIVDVFDGLTTKRVYKDAVDTFNAFKTMMNEMWGALSIEYLREYILMFNQAEKGHALNSGRGNRSKSKRVDAA